MWILEQFSSALNKAKHGLAPALYALERNMGLPIIRGTWFFVDPKSGSNLNGGRSIADAVADIEAAYNLCTTNVGDGIVILSSDATTTANTTSYLSHPLVWAKNSITVIGISAPTKFAQRARISNVTHTTGTDVTTIAFPTTTTITDSASGFLTAGFEVGDVLRITGTGSGTNDGTGHIITAVTTGTITCAGSTFSVVNAATTGSCTISSYCTDLISVTGSNNSFMNLHLSHLGADALELTALKVSGSRNYFANIHAGVGVADANTTITHSLWLAAAAENTFESCTFGLDTVDRGGVATYDIYLSGAVARNEFHGCRTTRHSSTGTGCLAIYADTTTGGRPTLFVNCIFSIWNTAGGNANCSYMFGSTGACDFVWFVDCTYPGYAALSNDSVAWISGEVNTQASGLMYT
jgi:hypothetical protein